MEALRKKIFVHFKWLLESFCRKKHNLIIIGFLAIATPGELYGYWLAYTKYGSGNVTWSEIIQPTIDLCKNGVPVSEFLANVLKVKEKQFKTLPYMRFSQLF